jgi:hypothetical protein
MENLAKVVLDDETIFKLAERICQAGWGPMEQSYANRANRDAVARIAKSMGATIRRWSIPNQLLDPRYVIEGSHLPNKGLANDKQMFSAIYHLGRTL